MAKRSFTVIESDISGESNAETVVFGVQGKWYEIDLTKDEENELNKALSKYLALSREVQSEGDLLRFETAPGLTPEDRQKIRTWAQDEGYEVTRFGKLPTKVVDAYLDAHPDAFPELRERFQEQGALSDEEVLKVLMETQADVYNKLTAGNRERIRQWARENGYEVNDYGRIPKRIISAFREDYLKNEAN